MLLLTLGLALMPVLSAPASAAPSGATLLVIAPKQAKVGEPFDIRLVIQRAQDAAGFESSVLFDPSAAEFDDLQTANSYFMSLGRDIGQLAAPQTTYGAAIGFYSCPVTNCLDNNGARHARGGNGIINLGTVTLVGDEPGALDVTFDAAKLVDATGATIPLTVQNPTVTVDIGASSSPAITPNASAAAVPHPAPPGRWKLPDHGNGNAGPFSTTGSGSVTNQDVMQVAMAWENLREHNNPCGPGVDPQLDVNHDGCIDVSDVEAVAANYSTTSTTASASSPSSTSSDASYAATAAASTTFVVNSTGDQDDAKKGNGICATSTGTCTLRAAIAEANNTSGPNTITFNIPGSGVQTIHLNSALPALWDTSGPTTIDGYTQPGSSPNTDPLADNAKIMVQVEGGGEDQYDALPITSPGNTIRGLAFYKFQRSFWIYGNAADNNTIVGCFVGTNAAGTYGASAESPTQAFGFHIEQGAGGTTIGTPNLADRNVISGNGRSGVGVWHFGSNHEVVQNNIVGLSPDGTRRVPNQLHGLDINYGTQNDLYGGTGLHEHNVVSGNDSGIDVSHTAQTAHNQVVGNYVGTDLTGNNAPSYAYNTKFGIRLEDGVQYNTISDNVIGGSSNHASGYNWGIWISINTTSFNTIKNNRIGVTLNGTPNPNGTGITIEGHNNTIGPGNIIANNLGPGIDVQNGAPDNKITANSIFANGGKGIKLETGGNNNLAAPNLTSATTTSASGTACGSCKIELFIADGGSGVQGEGKTLVGSGTAGSGGAFTISMGGVSSGNWITATATDSSGDTSEFAVNVQASGGTTNAINLPGHFEAEDYNPGGQNVGYFDTTSGNTGGAYRNDDVDIGTCKDPTTPSGKTCYNVGWIAKGEWLAYTVNVASADNYTFGIRVATPDSGAQMHVEIDGNNVSGTISVPNTGGWQNWQTITKTISLPAGTHVLKLVTDVASYNLNYVDVSAGSVSAPAAPTNLQANAVSSGEVDLSWTDNATNESAYVVERQTSGSSTWTVLTNSLPAGSKQYNDNTVSPSTTYTYRVKATNSGGDSGYATSSPVTTPGATAMSLPGHFEAEDYKPGGEGVGYHDTTAGNTGGAYRNDDVDIQTCTDSTTPSGQTCYNVGWVAAGEWLAYSVNIATAGNYTFAIRVATPYANRQMHIVLDKTTNISGTINVPNTGGFTTWKTVTTGPISLPSGTHEIRLVFDTASMNINYVNVAAVVAPATTSLPGRVEAENFNPGGETVAYHDTTPGNSGGAYRQTDVDIQTCSDPTTPSGATCYNIGWVAAGEWLAYDVNVPVASQINFSVRVATPYAKRQLHLMVDGNNISGTVDVPNTGGFQNWRTVSAGAVALSSGTHHVRVVFDTASINIDYFEASAG